MLNVTQIPALRVAFIDEKTGLISREWYRFLLNLFTLTGSGTSNVSLTDLMVGPPPTTAEDQIAEIQKAIQALALTPLPPTVGEIINIVHDRLQDLEVGPSLSGLLSDIAVLQSHVQDVLVAPDNSSLVSEVAQLKTAIQALEQTPPVVPSTATGTVTSVDGSGGTTGLTLTGGPITSAGTLTIGGTLGTANGGTGSTSLTGAGIVTITATQTVTGVKAFSNANNTFYGLNYSTSDGSSGANSFWDELSGYGRFGGANGLLFNTGAPYPGTTRFVVDPNTFRPFVNNTYALGTTSFRYSTVYSQNLDLSGSVTAGTWNGSTIGIAYGGTNTTATPLAGGIAYGTGAAYAFTAGVASSHGQMLIYNPASGLPQWSSTASSVVYATSDGAGGANAFFDETAGFGRIGGTNGLILCTGAPRPGTSRFVVDPNTFRPFTDNVSALGTASFRYTVVYATTGTINTSDGNQKQQVAELTVAEQAVAKRIKSLIRTFKFNDAVEAKGDSARIHVGVIAQDVRDAFTAEGLDPTRYGLFCSDTWTEDSVEHTRLGVRYDQLLAFVIAAI